MCSFGFICGLIASWVYFHAILRSLQNRFQEKSDIWNSWLKLLMHLKYSNMRHMGGIASLSWKLEDGKVVSLSLRHPQTSCKTISDSLYLLSFLLWDFAGKTGAVVWHLAPLLHCSLTSLNPHLYPSLPCSKGYLIFHRGWREAIGLNISF